MPRHRESKVLGFYFLGSLMEKGAFGEYQGQENPRSIQTQTQENHHWPNPAKDSKFFFLTTTASQPLSPHFPLRNSADSTKQLMTHFSLHLSHFRLANTSQPKRTQFPIPKCRVVSRVSSRFLKQMATGPNHLKPKSQNSLQFPQFFSKMSS